MVMGYRGPMPVPAACSLAGASGLDAHGVIGQDASAAAVQAPQGSETNVQDPNT